MLYLKEALETLVKLNFDKCYCILSKMLVEFLISNLKKTPNSKIYFICKILTFFMGDDIVGKEKFF